MTRPLTNGTVLVVDDDAAFRTLVANLLSARNYSVVQAASPQELPELDRNVKIRLAIVDWSLRGIDSEWLHSTMNAFTHFPVLFVSNKWCNRGTFQNLRKVAAVSLFAKKPIVPEILLYHVEALAPNLTPALDANASSEGIANLYDEPSDSDSPTAMLKQMLKLRSRLEMKNALKFAQAAYVQELQSEWRNLTANIKQLKTVAPNKPPVASGGKRKSDRDSNFKHALLHDAINASHKIKGTAGSLGLPQIAEYGANLEKSLTLVTLGSATQGKLWAEITEYLTEGEKAVRAASAQADNVTMQPQDFIKVLLVGPKLQSAQSKISDCSAQYAADYGAALSKAARWCFDAVLIDLSDMTKSQFFELCAELRTTAGGPVPIGVIDESRSLSVAECIFAGVSVLVETVEDVRTVDALVHKLLDCRNALKRSIVLVDDDQVLCGFIKSVMTAEGFDVYSVNDPIDALDMIAERKPALVIVDVSMPGLIGFEVVRMIRENSEFSTLPVLCLTGNSAADTRASAFKVGADDFLSKPVLMEEIVTRVHSQLDKVGRIEGNTQKDDWTQLLTEDAFLNHANRVLDLCKNEGRTAVFALLSIDNIQTLIGELGPAATKEVIAILGKLIARSFRASDLRGRIYGTHFALLFGDTDTATAQSAVQLLIDSYEKVFSAANKAKMAAPKPLLSVIQIDGRYESIEAAVQEAFKQQARTQSGIGLN